MDDRVIIFRTENKELTGKRIRCIQMNDEHPVESGTEGTISCVDDMGTIHVNWDNGRTIGLVQNEDQYELLN